MATNRQKFRNALKNVPAQALKDIEIMLAEKYDITDVEVNNITLKPLDNPTQADCIARGKQLYCRKYKDNSVRCWCI